MDFLFVSICLECDLFSKEMNVLFLHQISQYGILEKDAHKNKT